MIKLKLNYFLHKKEMAIIDCCTNPMLKHGVDEFFSTPRFSVGHWKKKNTAFSTDSKKIEKTIK
ncbi:MAG: hypothetical protein Q8M94_10725 [Ignavibacteria bacterium]|nr:hypothetical protein [Ignavibacteria bacterium]